MENSTKSKIKKVVLIVVAVLLVLIITIGLLGYFFLNPLLSDRLKKAVLTSSDGLYHLNFKNINYDWATGNARVYGVTLHPDTVKYTQLEQQQKASDTMFDLQTDTIALDGLHPVTILFSKRLAMRRIFIANPKLKIIQRDHAYNDNKTEPPKTPYQIISKFVRSFSVDNIDVPHVNFTLINRTKPEIVTNSIQNLTINAVDLLIDSTANADKKRFFYAKECRIQLGRLELPSDKLNNLWLEGLQISTKTNEIILNGIHLEPKYADKRYAEISRGDDRISINGEGIKLQRVDMKKLIEERKLYVGLMTLEKGDLRVYSDDRNFGTPKHYQVGKYPHQLFYKLEGKMKIDTVKLKTFKIVALEYNPETSLTANINFMRMYAQFTNVTNDTIPLQKNPIVRAYFSTMFLDKANMKINMSFNLTAHKGDFTCTGKVAPIDARAINGIINALEMKQVDSGVVDSYNFAMKGNDDLIYGSSMLLYHDVRMAVLKHKEYGSKNFKTNKLQTFLANLLMLKGENPKKNEAPRAGKIYRPRNVKEPFFYELWKALLTGIDETIM